MPNVVTTVETNAITTAQMVKVREVDFVQQFTHNSLNKLVEVLGVTRKIPMQEGTTLYVYTITDTLGNGAVPEGEIIPLSKYERTKDAVGEITLKKWRKATTKRTFTATMARTRAHRGPREKGVASASSACRMRVREVAGSARMCTSSANPQK